MHNTTLAKAKAKARYASHSKRRGPMLFAASRLNKRGLHLLSQASQLSSSVLVLGNEPVTGQFKGGVAGAKQRPRSREPGARSLEPGQRAFHSSMVTIRVNTFRHLSRSRFCPGKGKHQAIQETTALRAHVKNSFSHPAWRFTEGSRGSTAIPSFLLSELTFHKSNTRQVSLPPEETVEGRS